MVVFKKSKALLNTQWLISMKMLLVIALNFNFGRLKEIDWKLENIFHCYNSSYWKDFMSQMWPIH